MEIPRPDYEKSVAGDEEAKKLIMAKKEGQ